MKKKLLGSLGIVLLSFSILGGGTSTVQAEEVSGQVQTVEGETTKSATPEEKEKLQRALAKFGSDVALARDKAGDTPSGRRPINHGRHNPTNFQFLGYFANNIKIDTEKMTPLYAGKTTVTNNTDVLQIMRSQQFEYEIRDSVSSSATNSNTSGFTSNTKLEAWVVTQDINVSVTTHYENTDQVTKETVKKITVPSMDIAVPPRTTMVLRAKLDMGKVTGTVDSSVKLSAKGVFMDYNGSGTDFAYNPATVIRLGNEYGVNKDWSPGANNEEAIMRVATNKFSAEMGTNYTVELVQVGNGKSIDEGEVIATYTDKQIITEVN